MNTAAGKQTFSLIQFLLPTAVAAHLTVLESEHEYKQHRKKAFKVLVLKLGFKI